MWWVRIWWARVGARPMARVTVVAVAIAAAVVVVAAAVVVVAAAIVGIASAVAGRVLGPSPEGVVVRLPRPGAMGWGAVPIRDLRYRGP